MAAMLARMRGRVTMISSLLRNLLPLPALGRLQHGIGDVIGREAIPERRGNALPFYRRAGKIGELVNERVLVTDLEARHPPMLHVGMIAIGDVHAAPATHAPFSVLIEILDAVQVVQIPER